MAFATKYEVAWMDVNDVLWGISIQEDGWGGGTTEFTPGATPCVITWNQDEKYQPIVGSNADIQLVYESTIDDLFTEESQYYKVIISSQISTVWTGFLSPGQYYRDFNNPKHYVTLTANDGLGELKNILFEDGSGDPYYGQATQIQVISDILSKTGLSLLIYESVNIFETNHTTGAAYSPLNQTYLYREKYWDEQTDERSNCYDVLSEILTNYGAIILQSDNDWRILRPNSFSMDTIYYRIFTAAGVYDSNSSYTSYKTIDTDGYYVRADQEIWRNTGLGFCKVIQKPPYKKNMFFNGSFDSFTWTGGVPDYWTEVYSSGTTLDASLSGNMLRMGSNGSNNPPTEYLQTTVDLWHVNSMQISFDWKPTYTGAPTSKLIYLTIYDGTYYYVNAGWQAGAGNYIITVPSGGSGTWFRTNIDVPAQTSIGYTPYFTLTFRIYEFNNENPPAANYVDIDNLILDVGTTTPDEKVFIYENTANINYSKNIDIALGDTYKDDYIINQRDDSMFYVTTYSDSGSDDGTYEWSITGDPTAGAKLGQVLARQTVEGYRKSLDQISGTIRFNSQYDMPITSFIDTDFVDDYGYEKRFFPMGIALNTRLNEWSGNWIECPATYTDSALEWASSDYDTYTITANEIEVDSSAGAGTATSEIYVGIAGETVRVVIELTNDGGSNIPGCTMDGNFITLLWGTNYKEVTFATAGNKTVVIGNDPGETHNYTATLTVYGITGI